MKSFIIYSLIFSLTGLPALAQQRAELKPDQTEIRAEQLKIEEEERQLHSSFWNQISKDYDSKLEDHENYKDTAAFASNLQESFKTKPLQAEALGRTTNWLNRELESGHTPSEDDIVIQHSKELQKLQKLTGPAESRDSYQPAYKDMSNYIGASAGTMTALTTNPYTLTALAGIAAGSIIYDPIDKALNQNNAVLKAVEERYRLSQERGNLSKDTWTAIKLRETYAPFTRVAKKLIEPEFNISFDPSSPENREKIERKLNTPQLKKYEEVRANMPSGSTPGAVVEKMLQEKMDQSLLRIGEFSDKFARDAAFDPGSALSNPIFKGKTPKEIAFEKYEQNREALKLMASGVDLASSLCDFFQAPNEARVGLVVVESLIKIANMINEAQMATYATTAAAAMAAGSVTFGIGAVIVVAAVAIKKLLGGKGNKQALMNSIASLSRSMDRQFEKQRVRINKLEIAMHKRFDQIFDVQIKLFWLCMKNFKSLEDGQIQIQAMMDRSLGLLDQLNIEMKNTQVQMLGLAQANVGAKFDEHSLLCLGRRDVGVDRKDFDDAIAYFVNYGSSVALNPTFLNYSTPEGNEAWDSADFLDREFSRRLSLSPTESIWYQLKISSSLNSHLSSQDQTAPKWMQNEILIANPVHWMKAATAFFNCANSQAEFADRVSIADYAALIRVGEETQRNLEKLRANSLIQLLDQVKTQTDNLGTSLLPAFREALDRKVPNIGRAINFESGLNQSIQDPKDILDSAIDFSVVFPKSMSAKSDKALKAQLDNLQFNLSDSFTKKLAAKIGSLKVLGLGEFRISVNVKASETIDRVETHEYVSFDSTQESPSVTDNEFLEKKWNRILKDDWAPYFLPSKFKGFGQGLGFFYTEKSILPSLPQLEWKKTYLPVSIEAVIDFIPSAQATALVSDLKENVRLFDKTFRKEILLEASPIRRTFDFDSVMARVKNAYLNPKLYDGKNGGMKVDAAKWKKIAHEQIAMIEKAVRENQFSKTRRSHLKEGGFKGGPFLLNRIQYKTPSPNTALITELEDMEFQITWIKTLKLPAELKRVAARKLVRVRQDAVVAASIDNSVSASPMQNLLKMQYSQLNGTTRAIQNLLRVFMSQSLLTNSKMVGYAFDLGGISLWSQDDWQIAIASLTGPSAKSNPAYENGFDGLKKEALTKIEDLRALLTKIEQNKTRERRYFGERLQFLEPMLTKLCVGYDVLSKQRTDALKDPRVTDYCRPILQN